MATPPTPGEKSQYDFIWERRQAVLTLLRRGIEHKKIHRALQTDQWKYPCMKTISNDVKAIRNIQMELATDLLGDQKKAVADYVSKTLELRHKAMVEKDYRLVNQLDKDLLKFVGVNLDKVEVAFDFGELRATGPMTFQEKMAEIRDMKGLPAVDPDDY